jgi:hypothetical protein
MNLEDTYSLVVESIAKGIDLSRQKLTTLVGQNIPKRMRGSFRCNENKKLTSLEGSPKYVGGSFFCTYNSLVSLEGAPEYVGSDFFCDGNKLTSLEGAPRYVGYDFSCFDNNNLTSLEGLPEYIGGHVYCDDYIKKGENTYIIITSQIKGWYQGERDIDMMFERIEELFSK